jgi:tubulin polyglutamylase TTLL6/13
MHLTNYAINKNHENFVFNQGEDEDVGHKRSLNSIYKLLKKEGGDIEELKKEIKDIVIKTIITA